MILQKHKEELNHIINILRDVPPLFNNIEQCVDYYCDYYNISRERITLKRNNPEYVFPRHRLYYLLRESYDYSLGEIHKKTKQDKSTIIKGVKKIQQYLTYDTELRRDLQRFVSQLWYDYNSSKNVQKTAQKTNASPAQNTICASYPQSALRMVEPQKQNVKGVQRRRTKGYTLPPNTVCVNRTTPWGNPFRANNGTVEVIDKHRTWHYLCEGDIHTALRLYQAVLNNQFSPGYYHINIDKLRYIIPWAQHFKRMDIRSLTGKNLACFCPLHTPCHRDILIDEANLPY